MDHAWAELNHDLGYKNPWGLHTDFQRRFSRIAALLEIADEEFITLSHEIKEHERQIKEDIASGKKGIPITRASIIEFLNTHPVFRELEPGKVEQDLRPDIADRIGENLTYYGIKTLDALGDALQTHKGAISKYLEADQQLKMRGRSMIAFANLLPIMRHIDDPKAQMHELKQVWRTSDEKRLKPFQEFLLACLKRD